MSNDLYIGTTTGPIITAKGFGQIGSKGGYNLRIDQEGKALELGSHLFVTGDATTSGSIRFAVDGDTGYAEIQTLSGSIWQPTLLQTDEDTTYLGLSDTPSAYTGHANKSVTVTSGETALEFTTIDHGNISGLTADDHTQYSLVDGSRGFTSTVSGVDPTQGYHLATKQHVADAISTSVKKHIVIKPSTVKLGASAPTQAVIGNFPVLQFNGVSITEIIYTSFHTPVDWSEGTDFDIHVHWAPVNANAGTVVWQMTYDVVASNANEVISNVGDTIYVLDDTEGIQDELLESPDMTISGTNIAPEDTMGITIFRDPTHGDDDYTSDASLVWIEIEYTSDKFGETI